MSELNRLRELAALFKAPSTAVVYEASAKSNQGFEGVKSVVEDCLADLSDKLGEGGALETLMDKEGLSNLDTKKDRDGKTMLERLAIRTQQYKEEVDKTLLEIELLFASDPVTD